MVGERVVIRRLVPGERGPSGGPSVTDALGICTAWGEGRAVVRRADDTEIVIPLELIVAGKVVPPRPLLRHRVTPREAQERAMAMFPDLQNRRLGTWTLRWSDRYPARRANSVLAMSEPGIDDPVAQVTADYAGLGRRPIAAVLPDSPEERLFLERGWVRESAEPDSLFQLAGMAVTRRNLVERPPYSVEVTGEGAHVAAVIPGHAHGSGSLDHDWLGLRSVRVEPSSRRRGYATALIAALLDWGAERGAMTAYLQVLSDNDPGLRLYERLGFLTHHAYRYLAAPGS